MDTSALTEKIGPLPGWGWVAIVGGGLAGVAFFLSKRKSSTAAPAVVATQLTPNADALGPFGSGGGGFGGGGVDTTGKGGGTIATGIPAGPVTPFTPVGNDAFQQWWLQQFPPGPGVFANQAAFDTFMQGSDLSALSLGGTQPGYASGNQWIWGTPPSQAAAAAPAPPYSAPAGGGGGGLVQYLGGPLSGQWLPNAPAPGTAVQLPSGQMGAYGGGLVQYIGGPLNGQWL